MFIIHAIPKIPAQNLSLPYTAIIMLKKRFLTIKSICLYLSIYMYPNTLLKASVDLVNWNAFSMVKFILVIITETKMLSLLIKTTAKLNIEITRKGG